MYGDPYKFLWGILRKFYKKTIDLGLFFFFTYQSVFSHILFQNIHVCYPTVWISHVRYLVHVGDDFEEVFSGEAARSKSRLAFILLIYLQTPLTPTLDFDVAMVKISNMIPD